MAQFNLRPLRPRQQRDAPALRRLAQDLSSDPVVPTSRTRRTFTPVCSTSGGGIPEHLQQNFSRYIDVPAEGSAEADGSVDLSGGTALAQKIWEEFDADTLADRGVIVAGDPDSCIRAAKLHEATGVDQLQFLMATETVAHDKVMESIEMFGKHVFPAFK